jgi:hypothetical protein
VVNPLKEGLKQQETLREIAECYSLSGKSIKRRIETSTAGLSTGSTFQV